MNPSLKIPIASWIRPIISASATARKIYSVLSGCASGANLYVQPVAEFAQAVEQTSVAVQAYAGMEQRLKVDDVITGVAQSDAAVGFTANDCAPAVPAAKCVITHFSNGEPLFPDTLTAPPPQVVLMDKMTTYTHLLVSIAGAASEADLLAQQRAADAAFDHLRHGVHSAKDGDFDAAKGDLKAALSGQLGALYLENKRIKLLAALVKAGDPVVAALADTLASVSGDIESQFIISQRGRVGQLVDNFDVLGAAYAADMGAVQTARYQAQRRAVLRDAIREAAVLHTLLVANPKAAFAEMKAAHGELLRALTLADSDLGKAMAAIQAFSATAKEATGALDALKGLM